MRFLTLTLVLASLFCLIEAHSPKQKRQIKKAQKKFNKLKKRAIAMEETLNGLSETLTAISQAASVQTRHTKTTDKLTIIDATFSSNQCGAFTLSSWSTTLNYYSATGAAASSASPFASGTFTPQINAWYHICSFSRFRSVGNSNDVTVEVSGTVVAAYGNADTSDWRTTGVCFDAYLTTTQFVQVKHKSGGSSDCIQSTSWPYNKFIVHNTGNNA